MRFRTLLSLAIMVPLVATAVAVIIAMYHNANARSTDTAQRLLSAQTARAGERVRDYSSNAVNMARSLENLPAGTLDLTDSNHLCDQLLAMLRANPGVTWISFSDAAGTFTGVYRDTQGRTRTNQSTIKDGKTALVEQVVDAAGKRTTLRQDPDSGYDPRTRDFYREAIKKKDVVWLPPYVFFGQLTPGISCAIAHRAADGGVQGVFSVDYDLQTLSTFARQVVASDNSQVMIFTTGGVMVAHSSARVVETSATRPTGTLVLLADVHDPVTDAFNAHLHLADLPTAADGPPRQFQFSHSGEAFVACVLPVNLDSGPMQYVATVAPVHDFAPTAWQSSGGAILIVLAALIIAGVVVMALTYHITEPISELVGISERIGKGELNVDVHLGPIEEFRRLGQAFDLMLAHLRDWVRVRTSLQLAMEIQRNLLPSGPPKVPGFDIAGFSIYCDETGGDYYDYILVDPVRPTRFFVAVGDVMGHGLPSALMMAGARGILRSSISNQIAPGALLTRLNSLLYQDTNGDRFMTMLLACFDLTRLMCVWSSAGHDPPIIYDTLQKMFNEPEGSEVPLGIIADVEYGSYAFGPISEGQIIFLGSDGVWETFNATMEQFGKERLMKVIAEHSHGTAQEIKQTIVDALRTFRGDMPCKDDVTFVIIKVGHVPVMAPWQFGGCVIHESHATTPRYGPQ